MSEPPPLPPGWSWISDAELRRVLFLRWWWWPIAASFALGFFGAPTILHWITS